jgi:acyl carrier protein
MTESEKKLISIFHEISDNRNKIKIDLETKISDMGLDSLDVLDIIMRIQRELDVDIPILNFSMCKNVMDINQEVINARK